MPRMPGFGWDYSTEGHPMLSVPPGTWIPVVLQEAGTGQVYDLDGTWGNRHKHGPHVWIRDLHVLGGEDLLPGATAASLATIARYHEIEGAPWPLRGRARVGRLQGVEAKVRFDGAPGTEAWFGVHLVLV